MKLHELFNQQQLNATEAKLDKVFAKFNIDVVFTKHFMDRLNDPRNESEITPAELEKIYIEISKRYGNKLAKANPRYQALMQDLSTAINIPIVIDNPSNPNSGKKEMVAKTVMKKTGFSPNKMTADVLQVGLNTRKK